MEKAKLITDAEFDLIEMEMTLDEAKMPHREYEKLLKKHQAVKEDKQKYKI